MSSFEFVFSLFGLLLGFALVEVLSGINDLMGGRIRLGELSKLLVTQELIV